MNNIKHFVAHIQELIKEDELKLALEIARLLLQGSPLFNDALIQSGRYEGILKEIRMGTVKMEEARIEKNKIRKALLDIMEELEQSAETNTVIREEIEKLLEEKKEVIQVRGFNEQLTKQVMEAMGVKDKNVRSFLNKTQKKAANWESKPKIVKKVQDFIIRSFVGVVSLQLQKLMAIGEEKELTSEEKQAKYIDHCYLSAKRVLQLLCFALISKLWDIKRDQKIPLTEEQIEALSDFFEDTFERSIKDYWDLLKNLFAIFEVHELALPMSELADLKPCLHDDSPFGKAYHELETIHTKADHSFSTCLETEQRLATVLVSVLFLTSYKMVSIKNIAYEEMRNMPPRYLHYYTALGMGSKEPETNTAQVSYVEDTVATDAVLLYKGGYKKSINFFPFIIDLNALTFEEEAKICVFSHSNMEIEDEKGLNFHFLDTNKLEHLLQHFLHFGHIHGLYT